MTNYSFILAVTNFVSDVNELIEEASQNENIHPSHVNFVENNMCEILTHLEDTLEEDIIDQNSMNEMMNNIVAEIEYQRKAAIKVGYMNVYKFYNSVIDRWNELVDECEEV